ncbi:hypothetical protein FGO68_gene14155 [Halteria grandinella]|uniref:Uncharacterized protein n=1 Tax=Halteria grandinella TaxID=5974 RepID=A0A8J8P0U3_HALGN|nr:hypothetical protein FGO68_gene14155 [Halteria grandinella]
MLLLRRVFLAKVGSTGGDWSQPGLASGDQVLLINSIIIIIKRQYVRQSPAALTRRPLRRHAGHLLQEDLRPLFNPERAEGLGLGPAQPACEPLPQAPSQAQVRQVRVLQLPPALGEPLLAVGLRPGGPLRQAQGHRALAPHPRAAQPRLQPRPPLLPVYIHRARARDEVPRRVRGTQGQPRQQRHGQVRVQ